jgi:hypothetical protein
MDKGRRNKTMQIVEIGNLRETRAVINADGDRLPRCGIIIEATPDELAALPFNPVYAEVRLVPANGAGEGTNGERGRGWTK